MENPNEELKNAVIKLQPHEKEESNTRLPEQKSMVDTTTLHRNEGILLFDAFNDEYHIIKWMHSNNYPFDNTLTNYDSLQRLIHPDDRKYVVNGKLKALKLKEKSKDTDVYSCKLMFECSLKDKNGNYRRFHFQYSIADQDGCGNMRFFVLLINESGEYKAEKPARGMCILNRRTGQYRAIDTETCLTRTEIRVLKLLSMGYDSVGVANELNNSVCTINNHRCKILEKLGTNNVAHAVRYALMMEII